MRRIGTPLVAAIVLLTQAGAAQATIAGEPLSAIASRSMLAVSAQNPVRTGFSFGSGHTAIAFASGGNTVRLTSSTGATTLVGTDSHKSGLVGVHSTPAGMSPLPISRVRLIPRNTIAYILGPPLGYRREQIRTVVLPALNLQSRRLAQISGSLPAAFQGAPVVTRNGNTLGAVAAVAAHRWTFAPRARLLTLIAAAEHTGGGQAPPILAIIGGLVVVLLTALVVAIAIRRKHRVVTNAVDRRHAQAAALSAGGELIANRPPSPQVTNPTATEDPGQPLVRRRDRAEETGEEEFEVILKSHEQS